MTKDQLIQATVLTMRESSHAASFPVASDASESTEHEAFVIDTLRKRLPDIDLKTCQDFSPEAACCEVCHTFYPEYDMYLEMLSDGNLAWICCAVRSRILQSNRDVASRELEFINLKEALSGASR